jgi:3-deoxy-D-arabino-heptulosonate 7-phosphate (DAHP) synthase
VDTKQVGYLFYSNIETRESSPCISRRQSFTGRKDIAIPCAKAAIAAGADGIMVEVHPNPSIALSDSQQQLTLEQFRELWNEMIASRLLRI